MNKGNYISDWTNRITINYAQQLAREPFCGIYEDAQNWSMRVALKDGDIQYSITSYYNRTYYWFFIKTRKRG